MVKSQALRLVPGIKVARLCQALTRVSCARSSAPSWLPVSERAKARRNGISPSNSDLKSPPSSSGDWGLGCREWAGWVISRSLLAALGVIGVVDTAQQIHEIVRHRLLGDIIVHTAQFAAD